MHKVNVLRWVEYIRFVNSATAWWLWIISEWGRRMLTRIGKSQVLVLACHPDVHHRNVAEVPTEQEAG
jgi:hypothetical protein